MQWRKQSLIIEIIELFIREFKGWKRRSGRLKLSLVRLRRGLCRRSCLNEDNSEQPVFGTWISIEGFM